MRVLLIDPSDAFRDEAVPLLRAVPFVDVVHGVHCVEAAEAAVEAGLLRPEVVLLALAASVRNGPSVMVRIGRWPGFPRVVALTVFDEPEYPEGTNHAGAHAWIPKSDFASVAPRCLRRLLSAVDPSRIRSPSASGIGGIP